MSAAEVLIREREFIEEKMVLGAFALGTQCPDRFIQICGDLE